MPPADPSRKKARVAEPPSESSESSNEEVFSLAHLGADARELNRRRITFNSRVAALKDIIGHSGRGKVASELQVILALQGALLWDFDNAIIVAKHKPTLGQRVEAGAALSGLSFDSVRAKLFNFLNTGALPIEDTSLRGAGSPNYPAQAPLPADMETTIKDWVRESLDDRDAPKWITRLSIQKKIEEVSGVHCSFRRITRLAKRWGLEYQKLVPITVDLQSPLSLLQRRIYIYRLRRAYQTNCIVVYMDQSYCNLRCKSQMSYAPVGEAQAAFARKGGLGPRCCFQHMVDGRTGLVGASFNPSPLGDIDTINRNAEVMFRADGNSSQHDYHGNFAGGVFHRTILSRMIPALQAAYPQAACGANPTQTVNVVVDNAKYQCTSTPCLEPNEEEGEILRFNPMTLKKDALVNAMNTLGVADLNVPIRWTVEDDDGNYEIFEKVVNVKMDEDEQGRKGRPGEHPALDELRIACLNYLLNNSERTLMNDLEFELSRAGNFKALYNAPYFSWGMLIEMVWSQSKGFWQFTCNEGGVFSEMVDAIRAGMYTNDYANEEVCNVRGGNFVKDPITHECESANKLLKHMLYGKKKSIQVQIECDPVLRGGGDVPCNFDNFILPQEEIDLIEGCFTRFATDHKLKKYLEEKGEEDVEEQAQNLEEDSEGEDDD